MGFLSSLGKGISKALDYISAPLAAPITTFTKGISAGAAQVKETREKIAATGDIKLAAKTTATIIASTAVAAGAVLAAAPAASTGAAGAAVRSAVVSTAKAAIPTTTKGKIIAAVAAPVVIGAVVREPAAAASAVSKAPSALANIGGNIAEFAVNPSLETAKQIVKENPVLAVGGLVAGVGAAGVAVAPAISGYLTREELEKQTAAFERQANAAEAALGQGGVSVVDKSQGYFDTPASNNAPIPQTPATETLKTGTTTTRKRRKTTKQPMNISQKVNIAIQNRTGNSTKRYLNVLALPQSYGRIR